MKWLNSLTSLWTEKEMSEQTNQSPIQPDMQALANAHTATPVATAPVMSPQTDRIKMVVDATFEAAKLATRHRPLIYIAIVSADAAIDALWDKIFPAAKAQLTAKGVSV